MISTWSQTGQEDSDPSPVRAQLRLAAEAKDLLEGAYASLRAIAVREMSQERSNHTLQPTAIAHEAIVRLAQSTQPWRSRADFLAAAATTIRRVLIDHARSRQALKRGGGLKRVEIDDQATSDQPGRDGLLDLDQQLSKLNEIDPRRARVAELKLFAGMQNDEIAAALDLTRSTVATDWAVARAWLSSHLSSEARDA